MASKLALGSVKSHVGGLNVFSNSSQVEDSESPDMQNVEPFGISGIKKRRGYSTIGSAPLASNSVQGLFQYITNSGITVLVAAGGKLYSLSGTTWSLIGSGFSTSAQISGCQVGDRLYLFDGASALSYYNGSAISTTGITAAPTLVAQGIFFNKRIYCNSGAQKDRVYYGKSLGTDGSATNTGDFTSGTDAGYFGFGSSNEVIGFARVQTSLYVFLRHSIYKLDPTTSGSTLDHVATLVSASIGCQSARSIDNVENDVFFLDSTIYSLGEVATYNTIRTRNISAKVQSAFSSIDQASLNGASALYYDQEQYYLISYQETGSFNSSVLAYHVGYKAWFKWTNLAANCFMDFTDSSNVRHLYFGSDDSSDGKVYEMFNGINDNGSAIESYYKTKDFDFNGFHMTKVFQDWNIDFGNIAGTLTIYVYVDGALVDTETFNAGSISSADGFGTSPFGTFVQGREGNYTETTTTSTIAVNTWRWHRLTTAPRGTRFQLVYENNNASDTFEIKQATTGYIPLPYRARSTAYEI